jgi:7,8-dihydroneopterin aldolase/epimerase/oxygenase
LNHSEFIIELKSVNFFAFHGLHDEERKTGNEYEVYLSVKYITDGKKITKIENTINYVTLFEIVKQEMELPRNLLETIAISISEKIREQFSQVKEIVVQINKKNPPIINFSGSVAVIYTQRFQD